MSTTATRPKPRPGTARSALYAAAGYVGMLGLGRLIASRLADGGSFLDLGIGAMTVVVLAPLAALAGAMVGFLPYRHWRLRKSEAARFWSAMALVLGFAGVVSMWLEAHTAISTLLIGSTALVILRVALIERQLRTERR
jgi:hypothetical protein